MKRYAALIFCILVIELTFSGCPKDPADHPLANKPPKTFMWLFPDSTIAQGPSRQHVRWWGEDPDGVVRGYLFASDTLGRILKADGTLPAFSADTTTWHWRTATDSLLAFPLRSKYASFQVVVRAVDNSFNVRLPEQAAIHLSPSPYYDKNGNGIFDSGDQTLPTLAGATDLKGTNLNVPLVNTPPTVIFADPEDTTRSIQQPDTTFTAASFSWIGSDPDGNNTIVSYRIALNNPNDSTRWITIPGNVSFITLFVPRARSDNAVGDVAADIYSGKFLNKQLIGSVPGLKLDNLNVIYLQAKDIAGEYSPLIQLPSGAKKWFVRKPKTKLLAIVDYTNSDSSLASSVYHGALSDPSILGGSLANYDELNIGRGLSLTDKQLTAAAVAKGAANPKFGSLVPPFIDPAFIYTLFLYDYVLWYTDIYPSTPVAQNSLFQYYNSTFQGHKGKVIFSTSFQNSPDPGGLRDFAPIDSVSSVYLGNDRLLPTFGDTRLSTACLVVPDSSDATDIYPPLQFNARPILPIVSMRPLYKRPDARYIYHIQTDSRVPQRYVDFATLADLNAVSSSASQTWACGANGTILSSSDAGATWVKQKIGTQNTLRAIQFTDTQNGWVVGDDGTIFHTQDGGATWTNQSVLTFENLLGCFFNANHIGVIVGTNGLIIRSTNDGASWTALRSPETVNLRGIHFADQNLGIIVGDNGRILKSIDGGASWFPVTRVTNFRYNAVWMTSSATGFIAGANGSILKTIDGGDHWTEHTQLNDPSTNQPIADARSISFSGGGNGWICGYQYNTIPASNGVCFYTTDGGESWKYGATNLVFAQSPGASPGQILNSVSFTSATDGWAVGSGGVILHSTDGGASWAFRPNRSLNVAVIDGRKSFVFIGLPLHMLNNDPSSSVRGDLVKQFFRHVFVEEFGQ